MLRFWLPWPTILELTTNASDVEEVPLQEREKLPVEVIRVRSSMEKYQHVSRVVKHRKRLYTEREVMRICTCERLSPIIVACHVTFHRSIAHKHLASLSKCLLSI